MTRTWQVPPDAVQRYEAGRASIGDLAQEYGKSRRTVWLRLQDVGARAPRGFALPPDAVQRYEAGESLRDLAREYRTSSQTVGRRLQAAGVKLRGHEKTTRQRARSSEARTIPLDEARLRRLAAQQMSCKEIGAVLGTSAEVVRERMVRLGIPRLPAKARPEHNHFWKGGRTVDVDGYVLLRTPDHPYANHQGYVREHRLVMERMLGRFLEPGEVVDHRNGDKSDNDPSNLRLFSSNAKHLRETLKGRVPNWTEDGRRRIREGVRRRWSRRDAIPTESGTGDPQSP